MFGQNRDTGVKKKMEVLSLTNIQRAYLLGREDDFELGGCSTHVYYEFINQLNPLKFEKALNEVIQMQPVMRSVIEKNGTQIMLDQVPHYSVNVMHWEAKTSEEIEVLLQKKRNHLSHEVIPCGKWPMFSFEFAIMPDGQKRLFASYDLIVSDAFSFVVLANEIRQIYEECDISPLCAEYKSYLQHIEMVKNSKKFLRDKAYWRQRLDEIAPAPQLPYYNDETVGRKFGRRHWYVDAEVWKKIKQRLENINVTPTIAVLAAYAAVISFWSNQDSFTINLPMTSTMRKQKGMERVIGDFTESIILTLPRYEDSLEVYMKEVNRAFYNAFKHSSYDGIEIMGDIRKQSGETAMFPVVFTGMISEEMSFDQLDFFGEMVYGISQTPQVTLDCQAFETHDMLKIVWDYQKCCFKKREIDVLFDQFIDLLYQLAKEGAVLSFPEEQASRLQEYNNTYRKTEKMTLNRLLESGWSELGQKNVLKDSVKTYLGKEVEMLSECLAAELVLKGIGKGSRVGVLGMRCAETVIEILAVMKAGAAYVPINPQYPEKRRQYIMEKSQCDILLVPEDVKRVETAKSSLVKCGVSPEDEAYIIYTSGSTGTPKGVVITHDAVCNTIIDMNERFHVTGEDVFLNVASFGFDLSVYDLFGSMAVGAKLLIAEDARDINAIIEILRKENVTIWNSVPAEMGLVVDLMDSNETINSLRLVLLSGDWIPVDLPEKIKRHFPNAEIISLGGATEASIWSIYFPIEEDMINRSSVPYGYPLNNQQMYILDAFGRQLPYEVEGEIYIGGRGVAKGYDGDEVKTEEAFAEHKQFGRIYKTGDYGVMKREGYMEFRGRKDSQIKMHGYRVELGEIENAILKTDGVQKAVVRKVEGGASEERLVAYVVTDNISFESEEKGKNRMENLLLKQKESGVNHPDFRAMSNYMNGLEEIALVCMGRLFEGGEQVADLEQWMRQRGMEARYERLLKSWLNELTEAGFMAYEGGVWCWKKEVPAISVEDGLQQLREMQGMQQVEEIEKYFLQCCRHHEELLQGKCAPLELFYGEAKSDVAENIYGSNGMSQFMNERLATLVGECVGDKQVRILELGAGIGSASKQIFSVLDGKNVEYVYSDISDFFLEKAKENFWYDFMEYEVLDINDNLQSQGCCFGEFDFVIVANTLHDAEDIYKTLEFIQEILKKDGWLLMLETTRNTRVQMSSFGFLEGLANCRDFRKDSRGPMLDEETWIKVLKESGFRNAAAMFSKNDFDGCLWQNVFAAQNGMGLADVEEQEIVNTVSKSVPAYMVPSKVYRLRKMPLSVNGKLDKKQLPVPKKEGARKAYTAPETEMEKRLARLWEEHLHVEKAGILDNFFEVGGDSLKAIKLVTMASKEGIHFELADLYQYNTIKKLAEKACFIEKTEHAEPMEQKKDEGVSEEDMDFILAALE